MSPAAELTLSLLALLFGALLFAGVVWQVAAYGVDPATPDPLPEPEPYEAPIQVHGTELKVRPDGRSALRAEIAKAPGGRHRVEDLVFVEAPAANLRTSGKQHADWPWDTAEIELRWDLHFADQPDDLAVQREWIGTGRG